MRRFAAIAALAIAPTPIAAADPSHSFTGTWVSDLSSQSGLPVDDYLVRGGIYRCNSCDPPRDYAADGKPHRVPGADVISESVRIVGPRTIRTHIVSRAMDRVTTMTVSPDGARATYVSIDHRPGISGPLRTVYVAKRVAAGPPGSHAVSGKWQGIRYVEVPAQLRTVQLRLTKNSFSYSVPIGVSYTAELGGPPAVIHGPYGNGFRAQVKREGPQTIVETRTENGKLVLTRTFTLSKDGTLKTATLTPGSRAPFEVTSRRR